jgi:replication factor A1
MQVKDLKPRQGNVDIVLDVIDIGATREFEKFGKPGKVATAIAKDETGDIKLTLWNEDIDKVKAGDRVHLTNGYVSEWQGEMQLTTGRLGKLEVVGKSDADLSKEQETKIRTNIPMEESNKDFEELDVEEEDIEDVDDEEI